MNPSTKDKIEGAIHELKGKVKETVGHAVHSPDLEYEGKAEKLAGKVQTKLGQVEQVLERD
jgi:uncharacterized protein YjbJ (UPF0337 family)